MYGRVESARMTHANYRVSKGAVINLTCELAAHWARRNIR